MSTISLKSMLPSRWTFGGSILAQGLFLFARLLSVYIPTHSMRRFTILTRFGAIVAPFYRFKLPEMQWWNDHAFNSYIKKFYAQGSIHVDRQWMLYQLLRLTQNLEGDTAECGVLGGCSSYLICTANKSFGGNRWHYGFDSFAGLSAPSESDKDCWKKGDLDCPRIIAESALSEFDKVTLLQGWIPERFSEVEHKKFAFVHIDVDLYQPTLESIKFFYSRLLPGGVMVCDDYGMKNCPGATQAIEEFLADKCEKMIACSGGGGFFIKNTPVCAPFLTNN